MTKLVLILFITIGFWLKMFRALSLVPVLKQRFNKLINGKVKQINIKNRTYFFYNDQTNLKDFDARLLKVDKKRLQRD